MQLHYSRNILLLKSLRFGNTYKPSYSTYIPALHPIFFQKEILQINNNQKSKQFSTTIKSYSKIHFISNSNFIQSFYHILHPSVHNARDSSISTINLYFIPQNSWSLEHTNPKNYHAYKSYLIYPPIKRGKNPSMQNKNKKKSVNEPKISRFKTFQ